MDEKKVIDKKTTGISSVHWNELDENGKFKAARIGIGDEPNKYISWFDELFRGGIGIFGDKVTTLLIKGPPGSGKSTLALELCYRLGIQQHYKSLYISIESDKDQIIRNIKDSYGWEKAKTSPHFITTLDEKCNEKNTHVGIWNPKKLKKWMNISELVDSAFNTIAGLTKIKASKGILQNVRNRLFNRGLKYSFKPNILVVDSLNIVPIAERAKAFQHFLKISQKKEDTRLMIFILDGSLNGESNPFWDYFCDIVIEMDYNTLNDYYIRTFEIVKARYQEHVWGKHQLKIYAKEENKEKNAFNLSRAHPFRNEGGIFIFPSIHYYLSKYKRISAKEKPEYDATYPDSLNNILLSTSDPQSGQKASGGLPRGRCTAFIGCRGGHKSHLGYLHLLNRLCKDKKDEERVLVISLRDDEKMTENTMQRILDTEFPEYEDTIHTFKERNKLEILFFPPGYISPEEFLHRIFVSVHRMKEKNKTNNKEKHLTVMFNSMDQLNARFPLCAKQQIFIPSIIQLLTGEKVTSIFIAVEEKGQPTGQYGLLPMADLILSFHKYRMDFNTYSNIFKKFPEYHIPEGKEIDEGQKYREEVILAVERYAGGRKAGTKGILELGNKYRKGHEDKNTMNLVELDEKFDFNDVTRIE